MNPRLLAGAAVLLLVPALLPDASATADLRRIDVEPIVGLDAADLLARAEAAADGAFRARMVIVGLGHDGPEVAEVQLWQGADGALQVAGAASWLVGRGGEGAFWSDGAGRLLRLGEVERVRIDLAAVAAKYDVRAEGRAQLDTGPAAVVSFTEREGSLLRERLFVDEATGLAVRRETWGADGTPERVVVLTDLVADEVGMTPPGAVAADDFGPRRELSTEGMQVLDATGWDVPETLPGGFHLLGGWALSTDRSAVHLAYSDGLYTVSVYEQRGAMAAAATAGAEPYAHDGMHVYRWPGSEPERMVWTGAGSTFTAVTDAPMDTAMDALAVLPSETPDDTGSRLRRGLRRVADWAWPFN